MGAAVNWKRGFTRLYLCLSVAWALWGLYQPLYQRDKELKEISARAVRLHKTCLDAGLALGDCWRYVEAGETQMDKLSKTSVFHGYVMEDFLLLAALCFLPPIGGYLVLFVMIPRVFAWFACGFRRS